MKKNFSILLLLVLTAAVPAFAVDHDTLSALPGYKLRYDDMTGTTVIAATQAQLLTDAAQGGISFQYTVGGYCFVSIRHPGFNGLASALQIRTDHHFYDLTLNTATMASMGVDLNTLASNGIIMLVTPDCADMQIRRKILRK